MRLPAVAPFNGLRAIFVDTCDKLEEEEADGLGGSNDGKDPV